MKCIIETELTPERFAELGEPCRMFRHSTKGIVAIASATPFLGYPGHWLHPDRQPRQCRLSVYRESDGALLGVMASAYGVNDLAFHPYEDNLIIATGSYDGGFFFEGFLLRYDWKSGVVEQLLGQSREIMACRFDNAESITVLMRPENEEEFLGEFADAWSIVVPLSISAGPGPWSGCPAEIRREDPRMDGLRPSLPSDHGFADDILVHETSRFAAWRDEARHWLNRMGAKLYRGILDLRWIDDDVFSMTASGLALETRDTLAGIRSRVECAGNGVEMIHHPSLGLLSHVQFHGHFGYGNDTKSELWQWQNGQLQTKICFDRGYAFSFDSSGYGLAIDLSRDRQQNRQDMILDKSGRTIEVADLGRSNRIGLTAFPHGLGALYFLKSEGEDRFDNQDFCLWCRHSDGQFVRMRKWDPPERDFCPVVSVPYQPDQLLGAGPVYNRISGQSHGYFLEVLQLGSGKRSVSIKLEGSPTRVAVSEDNQMAVVGLSDGRVALADLSSRHEMEEIMLTKNGMTSVPLSLAIRGGRMLIGTHDGRVLMARLVM